MQAVCYALYMYTYVSMCTHQLLVPFYFYLIQDSFRPVGLAESTGLTHIVSVDLGNVTIPRHLNLPGQSWITSLSWWFYFLIFFNVCLFAVSIRVLCCVVLLHPSLTLFPVFVPYVSVHVTKNDKDKHYQQRTCFVPVKPWYKCKHQLREAKPTAFLAQPTTAKLQSAGYISPSESQVGHTWARLTDWEATGASRWNTSCSSWTGKPSRTGYNYRISSYLIIFHPNHGSEWNIIVWYHWYHWHHWHPISTVLCGSPKGDFPNLPPCVVGRPKKVHQTMGKP